ncbi:MAG: p-cumate dioxygenase small subunit [Ramlibacter sp.]|nr:p-cumate dioxygenase small subunit [Ramlibacter sp.]
MTNETIHREVEDFLFMEADLLDAWKLEEWLALFTPDGRYLVPSADLPDDASSETALFYIADDPVLLRERVKRLYKRNAHAEWPHSKTRHFISNVRLMPAVEPGEILARCVFMTHRHRSGVNDTFIGSTQYRLVREGEGLRIREKRCKLDYDNLHEQGRISILL